MNEDFSPIADVITLVANDQHAEATGLVNDLLGARVMDSLQDRKETIAQSLFAPSADSLQEEEQLDELSKATLGSYIQSRTHDLRSSGAAQGARGQWPKGTKDKAEAISIAKKEGDKIQAGMKLAARKMMKEEIVQEEHESVEDFVKRGGKIKHVAPGNAHGSQKSQTIKKAKQYFVKKG